MVILKDRILEFHPDTLEYVRKDVNLDQEGRIEEAVDILEDWVKKQPHFLKKDFPREYLERTLITAKGLVERAKQRIDKLCTLKTLMPELYPSTVTKKDFENLDKFVCLSHMPKLTKDHQRVYLFRLKNDNFEASDIHACYKLIVVICEYLLIRDYNVGNIVIWDFGNGNIMNFLSKCTPMDLRQIVTLVTEGYNMRIKQIHLITPSKMVDTLVALVKQIISPKLAERINLHKNIETLYDFVQKDVLPKDYGGEERNLQELTDEWRNALTAPDFVEYFEEMYKAKTDESCRQTDKFSEQYVGMPGSFRALSVD